MPCTIYQRTDCLESVYLSRPAAPTDINNRAKKVKSLGESKVRVVNGLLVQTLAQAGSRVSFEAAYMRSLTPNRLTTRIYNHLPSKS
jgi:hypothetical protein